MSRNGDKRKSGRQAPIAIIGMGCLFPNASSLKEYWRLLHRSEDAITDVPPTHWSPADYYDADVTRRDRTCCARGGFLSPTDFDPLEFGIIPTALEATDTAQLLSLLVAKAALEDAGYGAGREFDRQRAGVIMGVTGMQELSIPLSSRLGWPVWQRALNESGVNPELAAAVMRRLSDSFVDWQENSFPGLLGNVVAGRIANRLDLQGTNCVVDAACASSLGALHLALLELSAGRSDLVLTGGVDALNDIFMYMCFSKTQALSPTGDARPFAHNADGTVLGEGVGMLVLKRLDDARRDGDRVYAVIRGIGTSSDGRAESIYAPRAEGQARALREAYRVSGIDPSTVELVEAHGTGTKVGDVVEFEALAAVYRESRASGTWCGLGSVKSQIGHTKAAAGAASLIKVALALSHKVLPPTVKVDTPNPKLDIDNSPFYLNTRGRPWLAHNEHPRRACVSSFGFGGSNYHVVLEEHEAANSAVAWDGSVQIVALSAATRHELGAKLDEWLEVADGLGGDELARRAVASRRGFSVTDEQRLLIVVEHGADPAKLLRKTRAALESNGDQTRWNLPDVAFGTGRPAGEVALLFPGQASQYVGMGRELACLFPEARAALAEADAAFDRAPRLGDLIYPRAAFTTEQRARQEAELTSTDVAQPALGAVGLAMLRVLRRFGVRPRFTAGHSFGELLALRAADWIDDAAMHRLACLRGTLMADGGGDRGTMCAVQAPLDEIDRLLTDQTAGAVLANRNSPTQGVISGGREAVEQAAAACRERGWSCAPLNVSAAFHSSYMGEARRRFRAALDDVEFTPCAIAVHANNTAAAYTSDPNEIRDTLGRQLTEPVRFVEQIRGLHDAGASTFVEVGPKRILCGLVDAILDGRPHEAIPLDGSAGGGSALADLARALARLAALGHDVDLGAWDPDAPRDRQAKMAVALCGANYRAPAKPAPAEPGPTPAASDGNANMKPTGKGQVEKSAARPAGMQPTPATGCSPVAGPTGMIEDAYEAVREGLRAMQTLQQQTAAAHEKFLENQAAAHKTIQMVMENQQRLVERAMGLPVSPRPAAPTPTAPAPMSAASAVAPVERREAGVELLSEQLTLLRIISEKTGHAVESLGLSMDLESELGIDVVRRVEIVAELARRLDRSPPAAEGQAAGCKTPLELLRSLEAGTVASPAGPPASPAPTDADGFAKILLEIVAEQTGYPVEMLELDMDMESDLGIDSIKRVGILAAVEARLPDLRPVESYTGSLRTLRNIIDYMAETPAGEPSAPPAERPEPATAPPEPADLVIERRVLTAVDLPPATSGALRVASGREILVTDDGTGLAAVLAERLNTLGLSASVIKPAAGGNGEIQRRVGGLILLAPLPQAEQLPEAFLKRAFVLARKLGGQLREAAEAGGGLLATVSRCDGSFGLSGAVFEPIQGGLAGLAKTAAHEWPGVLCKALDVSHMWQDVDAIATAIVDELAAGNDPLEVGLDAGARRGLELVTHPALDDELPLDANDVVVVTGGARGVTAEAACALARACRPTLVLLGRSPEPTAEPSWLVGLESEAEIKRGLLEHEFAAGRPSPRGLEAAYQARRANCEIASTLERIESAGARVIYRSVDVRDAEAVSRVLSEIREKFGEIRGLIHAAGVLADHLIEDKTLEQFERVFDTKVAGLRALLDATAADSLRIMALFSSVSGRYGRAGQVDYAMANEVLNKVAQRQRVLRPDCRVVAINWGPWDGGMVSAELKTEFARLGVGLIPLAAGAECLVDELRGDSAAPAEVVLGSTLQAAPAICPSRAPAVPTNGDLSVAFERKLDLEGHPFMGSHVIGGHPVLPMAMMAEWLGHGALHGNPGLVLHGLDELRVFRGVILNNGPRDLRVAASRAQREGDFHAIQVELRGGSSGNGEELHARAKVLLAERLPSSPTFEMPADIDARPYSRGVERAYEEVLFHGPHFRGIDRVRGLSRAGLVADLRPAPDPGEWMREPLRSAWIGDPLIIDGALQLGILWGFEELGEVSLPSYGARYRQYRAGFPREAVTSVLQVRQAQPKRIVIDVTFLDARGTVIARMEGYEWNADRSLLAAFGKDSAVGV